MEVDLDGVRTWYAVDGSGDPLVYLHGGFSDAGEQQAIARITQAVLDGDVLDLGIGAGRTTSILAPIARSYVGSDYSPGMVAAARAAHPDVDLRVLVFWIIRRTVEGESVKDILNHLGIRINNLSGLQKGAHLHPVQTMGRAPARRR